jgi:uncharacterized protein involved in exopolysaccharide biosynthesis
MTTLPPTTPMRLPRPSGAGQIAIPSAPGPIAPPSSAGGIQMTGADVWRVFRANWWLILGMVVLMAVVGFFVNRYLAANFPKYTAGGLVRVQLREEQFSRGVSEEVSATPQAIELQLKTQARALVQPSLMIEALQSDKIRQTQWFNEFATLEDQKEDLLKNFSAQPIQNTRLIAIDMTYRIPGEARIIAEEIVNRYITEQQAAARTGWTRRGTPTAKTCFSFTACWKARSMSVPG